MPLRLPRCPCGIHHAMSREQRRSLARTMQRNGEFVEVSGYMVPRIYAVNHVIGRLTLPVKAAAHGWKKADAEVDA